MAVMNSYNQNVHQFNEQKTSWENAIHLYKGPDPLEYWYHYVNWYEQNYCYDSTNKMSEIIQKVLTQFNNINAYKQDHRMVKVWLKYVDLQPNPLNVFQTMYQRGIGTQLSFFYVAWANCYLKQNDFKLAESAINCGFQAQAKPPEDLQSAQQQVANSYYEYTQRQRPGPYQIVIQHQSPGNQPPLPAQVATNYQNQSFARDKRKLEDTFPVLGGPVKRGRPNEEYSNGQYAASGNYHAASNNNSNHYGQTATSGGGVAKVVYQNYAQPQQHQGYAQHHPQPGHENGKNFNHQQQMGHQGQGNVVVYHQQQQQQQPVQHHQPQVQYHHQQQQQSYSVAPQNGHGQTNGTVQYHNVHQQQQQQPQQVVYQQTTYPAQSISSNNHQHHQPPEQVNPSRNGTSNEYGDLNNSGHVIASSLNYVYEDYSHSEGNSGVILEEEVVEEVTDDGEPGIQIPENFARSATNSNNIWRAPLFLEEPYDPNRRPMYVKDQVYPVTGVEESGRCEYELSIEELRRNARLAATQGGASANDTMTIVEEVDPDSYVEYWTEEVTVQGDEYGGNVIHGQVISDGGYGEYVQEHHQNQENVYYHVMEPKASGGAFGERKSKSSKKKKSKRKKMIVQINDASDDDEEDGEEGEEDEYGDINYGGDEETTTIRYTCDQNGLGGAGQTPGSGAGDMRRITIKLRKQPPVTPNTSTPKVSFATNGRNGKNGGGGGGSGNGYGSGLYRRTATDADADLLLSLGNGQSGYYQEMKPSAAYNEDSSSYSEYNASYTSYLGGENSNSGPSTPVHSYQHHRHQMASNSATSTPQLTPAYRRLTKHRSNVSLMNDDSMSSTMNENSFFQGELDEEVKSRRLAKAVATIEEHMAKKSIDPFNAELCKALLTKIGFPSPELCDVYRMVQQPLPKLSNAKQALLGDTYYNVEKEVGRGTYGAVYKAANVYTGATVAIKFQKPANSWELYICNEIKKRITYHDILPGFMDITSAVLAPNGCVLISEFSPYGSLLDINNKIRQSTTRVMHESLAMHFTSQILDIVHYLHGCQIVHADIKPDNFLVMKVPNSASHVPTVRLIDFGCAIDMTLFPENTRFTKVIQTEGFTCTEMKENRPWTYQTDLYCVAATAHVMLFGEYMQVSKKFGMWEIKQKLPRYLKKNVWSDFFNKLLNIPNCEELPNLLDLKATIDNETYAMESELQKHIRTMSNLMYKR